MAAKRRQGGYMAAIIVAFVGASVALPAGAIALSSHPILGVLLGIAGQALLILSLVGFYRLKSNDSMND